MDTEYIVIIALTAAKADQLAWQVYQTLNFFRYVVWTAADDTCLLQRDTLLCVLRNNKEKVSIMIATARIQLTNSHIWWASWSSLAPLAVSEWHGSPRQSRRKYEWSRAGTDSRWFPQTPWRLHWGRWGHPAGPYSHSASETGAEEAWRRCLEQESEFRGRKGKDKSESGREKKRERKEEKNKKIRFAPFRKSPTSNLMQLMQPRGQTDSGWCNSIPVHLQRKIIGLPLVACLKQQTFSSASSAEVSGGCFQESWGLFVLLG